MYSSEEFEATYYKYADMTYRVCFSFLKNKEDTEDAVQSVFIKYIKRQKGFENADHEKAWFIVTASSVSKDLLRQAWRRHDTAIEDHGLVSGPGETVEDEVYAAILELPDKYKTVVYLYYYEGYKTKEIAKMLHRPASTIRNDLTQARRLLKKRIGGMEE